MQKKDYELVAAILQECASAMSVQARKVICTHFALRFAVADPEFNPVDFFIACGLAS